MRKLPPYHFIFVFLLALAATLSAAPVPPGVKSKAPETDEASPVEGRPDAIREYEARSMNNLKQMGVAVHNFASANQDALPKDVVDKKGKPLLSWRVQVLAFLEEDHLYRKFKLDESWDGPNNIKLLEKMPAVFASPRVKTKPGYTVYQGFQGNGGIINSAFNIGNIPDGTANTIWCVEATTAVPWTKPVDMPFDANKELKKFGKAFGETPFALLCDGSARTLDLKKISDNTLKSAITAAGGEVLGDDW